MNGILTEIADNWKLDARDENNSRYFFHTLELERILKGSKNYVIGRKGTGKTALREHLFNLGAKSNDVFTEKLTFKQFPWVTLYQAKNTQFTPPNQYITLWKLLIYSVIAKMMLRNKNIDSQVKESLGLSYKADRMLTLTRVVPEWLGEKFDVLPINSSENLNNQNQFSWIQNVEILEDIILAHLDNSKYYIIFDELDEDYRDRTKIEDYTLYDNLITSLFKAVQDVNATFKNSGKKIHPIIFLRDDIYSTLKDSDKNKWSDAKIELDWDFDKIKKLLAFRLTRAFDENSQKPLNFFDAWSKIFDKRPVINRTKDSEPVFSFDFIANSTHLRPRDFISYIQKCAEDTIYKKTDAPLILSDTVKKVDKAFSNQLKDEITDEIHPILPEIDDIYRVLSEIRLSEFTIDEFKKAYNFYLSAGTLKEKNINKVLQTLFEFSVIGNVSNHKHLQFFRYKNRDARLNYSEKICIHPGLIKALQIL